MSKIEKILVDQARYRKELLKLKTKSTESYYKCPSFEWEKEDLYSGEVKNCIGVEIDAMGVENSQGYDHYGLDEWMDVAIGEEGRVCEHCKIVWECRIKRKAITLKYSNSKRTLSMIGNGLLLKHLETVGA